MLIVHFKNGVNVTIHFHVILKTKAVTVLIVFFLTSLFSDSLLPIGMEEKRESGLWGMEAVWYFNPFSWCFQPVVSGEMYNCWTLPSICFAGIENGA